MKTKLTNGNTLAVETLEGGETRVAVTDAAGVLLASHVGVVDAALVDTLTASSFRLTKSCDVCGSSFRAKRAAAKHCSPACKTKAWRNRHAAAAS